MNEIYFSETLIHCSSLSKLTTEPRNKGDKDAGNLSETAKTHLIEVYALAMYNFKKDISNKYTEKGNTCEPEGLELASEHTGLSLEKNEETFFNEYFVGTPDAIVYDKKLIFDNKCAWDWVTLLSNIDGELDNTYFCQMQGYLDLLGFDTGYIAYTLIDTPESIRNDLKRQLFYKSNGKYLTEESPGFLREWEAKERNLIFSNYSSDQRILLFEVKKDEEYLEKARKKVEKSRTFLQEFHETHKNFNKYFVF
jgi:hypothetical protein